MSTQITINPDQTLSVTWTGRKGRGSLFHIMATGNAENCNLLGELELWAVLASAQVCPFPMGDGEAVYAKVLEAIQDNPEKTLKGVTKCTLGELRKAIVYKCGDSCNGPTDSYLSIAAGKKKAA